MSEEKPDNGINGNSNAESDAIVHEPEIVSSTELLAIEPDTDDDDDEEYRPLPADEFRSILQHIDRMGLTWTADFPPRVRFKDAESSNAFLVEEFAQVQKKYPEFPLELGYAIFYGITGDANAAHLLGDENQAREKVAAIIPLISSTDFRADFFFRYAIKVPYFSDIDWEITIKTRERGVQGMPGIAYALLSLVFERPGNPFVANEFGSSEALTVAVNEHLIDKLIKSLNDARDALKSSQEIAHSIGERHGNDLQDKK